MLSLTLGCMYSGKTSKLISDVNRNPGLVIDYDTGDNTTSLLNHNLQSIPCVKTKQLMNLTLDQHVYINEAQFFKDLIPFVKMALAKQINVYVYGLDGDFKQDVFGDILQLIPLCDSYVKLYATCRCGALAPFSKRLSSNREQYMPHDQYLPSCRQCL
jgi:thymidine kinase